MGVRAVGVDDARLDAVARSRRSARSADRRGVRGRRLSVRPRRGSSAASGSPPDAPATARDRAVAFGRGYSIRPLHIDADRVRPGGRRDDDRISVCEAQVRARWPTRGARTAGRPWAPPQNGHRASMRPPSASAPATRDEFAQKPAAGEEDACSIRAGANGSGRTRRL